MAKTWFWVTLCLALACGKDAAEKPAKSEDVAKPEEAKAGSASFTASESKVGSGLKPPAAGSGGESIPVSVTKTAFDAEAVPKEIKIVGQLTAGLRFNDRNGDNWVTFWKKVDMSVSDFGSEYIYAAHWAFAEGRGKELRLVKDSVERCEFDLQLDFDEASIDVTDLDADGFGEVNFGYRLRCASDVSPADYKYLMLENGEKYIIRGSTKLILPGEPPYGGEMKVDPSFKSAPASFLAHAKERWADLTVERP